jgi:nitroreductase
MDFSTVVRRRRMVRAFRPDAIAAPVLGRVLHPATRSPSAGHTQGVSLVVLEHERVGDYWDATLPPARRVGFSWPGLLAAPVLVVVAVDPLAYVERYAETDKTASGLGAAADAWPQPMWFVDAGMAVHAVLLAAVDEGLGACFFGVFEHEAAVRALVGAPAGVRIAGTVALGFADPTRDRPSSSAGRSRRSDVVRFGAWG